ncbi:hypothetical protein D3C84_961010 [compost metagenome]
MLHALAQTFLTLALDGAFEVFEGAVDVVVTGQELLKSGQVLGSCQGEPIQPVHSVAAFFLGELFPFGDALQVLDTFLQTQLLLLRKGDDGVAHAAFQVG